MLVHLENGANCHDFTSPPLTGGRNYTQTRLRNKPKPPAFRSPIRETHELEKLWYQNFQSMSYTCFPVTSSSKWASQSSNHDGLLQSEAIKGKLLLPPGTQDKAALCWISLPYRQVPKGAARLPPEPSWQGMGAGWGSPRCSKSQGALEQAGQSQLPIFQGWQSDTKSSHLVLHSLVFPDTLVVPAKNTWFAYLSLDRIM